MDSTTLIKDGLSQTEYQLRKVLEGLKVEEFNFRVSSRALSPIETVWHLTEVCHAFTKEMKGEKHRWGSFTPASTTPAASIEELFAFHTEAAKEAIASNSLDTLKLALSYLITHESYHIGQLCLMRREIDKEWDPYSIYQQ